MTHEQALALLDEALGLCDHPQVAALVSAGMRMLGILTDQSLSRPVIDAIALVLISTQTTVGLVALCAERDIPFDRVYDLLKGGTDGHYNELVDELGIRPLHNALRDKLAEGERNR
jgi:hypothetical protein